MKNRIHRFFWYLINANKFRNEMTLLEKLKTVQRIGPRYRQHGICFNVPEINFASALDAIYPRWEKWSGSYAFPIQDPNRKEGTHKTAGCSSVYFYADDKWAEDAYGDLRRELLAFLIDALSVDSSS